MRRSLALLLLLGLCLPAFGQSVYIDNSDPTTGTSNSFPWGQAGGFSTLHVYYASQLASGGVCAGSRLNDVAVAPSSGGSGTYSAPQARFTVGNLSVSPPVAGNWESNMIVPIVVHDVGSGPYSFAWTQDTWTSLPGVAGAGFVWDGISDIAIYYTSSAGVTGTFNAHRTSTNERHALGIFGATTEAPSSVGNTAMKVRLSFSGGGATFEPDPSCVSYPSPIGAPGSLEGLSWKGSGAAFPDTGNGAGFPAVGSQYGWLAANGEPPITPPAGGPIFRPLPTVTELAIPIPAGATAVSFYWDFYNAEGGGGFFNDGMDISIVGPFGASLVPLVYADSFTPAGGPPVTAGCGGLGSGLETAPPGPNYFSGIIPSSLPPGSYLSVACWNGEDTSVDSAAAIDHVAFTTGLPIATTFDAAPADCTQVFPSPCNPMAFPGDPSWSGVDIATVEGPNGVGFPVDGSFGHLAMVGDTSSILPPPAGGPFPRPLPPGVNEVCIPLAAGTSNISFCWDFYNNEGGPSSTFNDSMSIDIVCANGVHAPLVYADTYTPAGTGFAAGCLSSGFERAPDGPNYFSGVFNPTPAGAWLSIVIANGTDTAADSKGVVDNIVTGPAILRFSQPAGQDILIQNLGAQPGTVYRTFLTFQPQINPWFFGLDILPGEAIDQLSNPSFNGPPFVGFLSDCGSSAFYVPPFGLPPGIPVSAVSLYFADALLGPYLGQTAPVTYISQ